jgi:hypothetical protein
MAEQTLTSIINKGGSHRSLGDAIYFAEVPQTPLVAVIPRASRQSNPNVLDEWPANQRLAGRLNATEESDIAEAEVENALENYGLLRNYIQYSRRVFRVGRRAQRTQNIAGYNPKKLYADTLAAEILALKKDKEMQLGSDVEANEGSGTTADPRRWRAIGPWISATAGGPAAVQTPAAHLVPSGQIYSGALSSLTFTGSTNSINAVMGALFDTTKTRNTRFMPCGRLLKEAIAQYTNNVTLPASTAYVRQYQSTDTAKVSLMVNTLETDNGTLDVTQVPFLAEFDANGAAQSAAIRQGRGYILDLETWEQADTLPMSTVSKDELPQNLGGDYGAIEMEGTLRCYCPSRNAAIKCTS